MSLLEVKELTKSFGSIKAVDHVSFSVPEGSIFGIIGRNGAGKTTTIRTIMNIILPDKGEILFKGKKADEKFRDLVGYLPEERGLYKKMKVHDLLLFFAEMKSMPSSQAAKRADYYLEKFGLLTRKKSKIEELSKGNQQKVQFIATILHEPEFIILDEPFTGLDPVNTDILKEIILDLKKEGKVIILCTHLMDYAEKLCDHISMINNGKIILNGSLSSIKEKFSQRNISLTAKGDLSFLTQLPFVEKIENFGASLGVKVADNSNIQDILKALIKNNVEIEKFSANDISLHEIFIKLAGRDSQEKEFEYVK